jgi:hypothetical protein
MDATVIKETRLTERLRAEIRVEGLNVFNHPTFAMYSESVNQQQFGKIANEASAPRRLLFGVSLLF